MGYREGDGQSGYSTKKATIMHRTSPEFENIDFGRHIAGMLDLSIRAGITGRDAGFLSAYIIGAGAGDYVEIGTWHGASAILAALTKRVYQIPGRVYCIDDFRPIHNSSAEEVMANARAFGVDDMIHICAAKSYPWPLGDRTFSFGLIDGDHGGLTPAKDFLNLSKRVSGYIMLDDAGVVHKNIALLAHRIHKRGQWVSVRGTDKIRVFRRRQ